MGKREVQRVRDPVHGLIVFGGGSDPCQNETDRIAWRLLNTREFQRLRRIRQNPNLYRRFRHILPGAYQGNHEDILFDDASVTLYKRYDFKDTSALNKVLVRVHPDKSRPRDIAEASSVIQAFRDAEPIQRVYAPDQDTREELHTIMEEVQ